MDIAEFLLARIAEDEAAARDEYPWAMTGDRWKHYPEAAYDELQHRTLAWVKRTLVECEAKRRIVAYSSANLSTDDANANGSHGITVLCLLALPYADHPDYQPEWKP